MERTTIIGLDPGASGAIAWCSRSELAFCKLDGMTERDIADQLQIVRDDLAPVMAYLELVGPSRSQDAARRVQGVGSAFKFGQSYGLLRGILIGLGIPFDDVRPHAWQKAVGIVANKGDSPAEKKRRNKAKAQQLYPDLKVTLSNCDAILLAEYGKRQLNGAPT